jgi:hypothetical protein
MIALQIGCGFVGREPNRFDVFHKIKGQRGDVPLPFGCYEGIVGQDWTR